MKWFLASVAVTLFGSQVTFGDMVPTAPPKNPTRSEASYEQAGPAFRDHGIPTSSIAAGVVAVTLSGSLVALRLIRKRNDDLPS
jgi:hypothetical protein